MLSCPPGSRPDDAASDRPDAAASDRPADAGIPMQPVRLSLSMPEDPDKRIAGNDRCEGEGNADLYEVFEGDLVALFL